MVQRENDLLLCCSQTSVDLLLFAFSQLALFVSLCSESGAAPNGIISSSCLVLTNDQMRSFIFTSRPQLVLPWLQIFSRRTYWNNLWFASKKKTQSTSPFHVFASTPPLMRSTKLTSDRLADENTRHGRLHHTNGLHSSYLEKREILFEMRNSMCVCLSSQLKMCHMSMAQSKCFCDTAAPNFMVEWILILYVLCSLALNPWHVTVCSDITNDQLGISSETGHGGANLRVY